MDDTLIINNKWVDVNTFLGVSEQDDYRLYHEFKDNKINYAQWMDALDILYNLDVNVVMRSDITPILEHFVLRNGSAELLTHLHNRGYTTAIITGSFEVTARAVADKLGIHHVVANTNCIFDERGRLTGIQSKGTESAMKNAYLLELCSALKIQPTTNCHVIGDSIYDQPMFLTTGKGITFNNATEELKHSALYRVDDFADLQKLLSLIPLATTATQIGSSLYL